MATTTVPRFSRLARTKGRGGGEGGPARVRVRDTGRQVRGKAMAEVDMYGFEMDRSKNFTEIWTQSRSSEEQGDPSAKVIGVVG